jgi:hypothetical protein
MSPARICPSSRAKSSTVDFFGDFFGEAVLGCGIDLPMRHLILSASGVGSTTIDIVLGKYMVETTTHKPVDRAVSFGGKHFEVAPDAFRKIDRDHFLAGAGRLRPGRPSRPSATPTPSSRPPTALPSPTGTASEQGHDTPSP